ncbi:zinc metalloprotease [Catellatospora sp. TT07R-123]|uniref:M4 family metallopeptidase n=1 Tax=Catellatospora sp. TT07R-123 TaxID=2733863 RepID=UPI001B0F9E59|nr:M4 family metallopeptidase [Catellatospora sp. TT07R-123]GHJ44410.1 zinc metalloprotease [Catellatospora sp. TT07R-123]
MSRRSAVGAILTATAMALAGTTAMAFTPAAASPVTPETARAAAANSAASLVAARPAYLHAGADDAFIQKGVISSGNMQYVPFERTYRGLPVVGGDFVLVTDAAGTLKASSVAQEQTITGLGVLPKVNQAAAVKTAQAQLKTVASTEATSLVVHALGASPRLAWATTVNGTGADGISRLTVYVDALTGTVLGSREHVTRGTGTGAINGPNPLTLQTTLSGGTYKLQGSSPTNMPCQDAATNTTFSKSTDTWGNGVGTSRETGCVDALFAAQTEASMLSSWLGRNGMNGSGGAWPIRVGLNDQNAYYDGTQVQIGKNTAGAWISSMDVVGHEMGHGIDDNTPGGISGGNTQEFVADTFGAATEWYANEGSAYDPPDFQVGEEINLVGSGPIRYMYNPSLAGDDNCYSSSIPSEEVHAAAGPGNHWFYLLAEGTSPTNGQPTSATCNSTTITGVGIQNAIKIMYNAMLMKTSSSSYLKYRTWTLTAAKNLDATCGLFNATKAAWNGVSVPAQTGDPTCTSGTPSPSASASPAPSPSSGSCTGQKLLNPGFESGAVSWTQTSGVITTDAGQPAHGGSYKAWLNGYGATHTDTLSQSVTIPAGCHATLTYYLHIDTAETSTTTAYDKLAVTAGTTTVASYSNLNKNTGYLLRTVDLTSFAGSTVTLKFTGTEDASLQTSFVVDDTALTLS